MLSQKAASASVPASVLSSTIKAVTLVAAGQAAAAGPISVKAAALTEGVLRTMLLTKLKVVTAVLLALGAAAFAFGMLATARTNAQGDRVGSPKAGNHDPSKDSEGDEEKPLTVTIRTEEKPVQPGRPFQVDLRVVNSSKSVQTFEIMSCSWDDRWKSSNDRVSWDAWECARNVRMTVKLEPGDAYEKDLPMLVAAGKPHEKITFKMGFTPIDGKLTYWSNEATLQVE